MKVLAISTEKIVRWVEKDDGLESSQTLVGGYIERLEMRDGSSIWLNEEGKIERLPFNSVATDLALLNGALLPGDAIVGDVFITGPGDGEGGDLPLAEESQTSRQLAKIMDEAGVTWRAPLAAPVGRTRIGDVIVCDGEPEDGNPYVDVLARCEAGRRRYALEAYRAGDEATGFTFWHAPANGGARRLDGPEQIDWRGM